MGVIIKSVRNRESPIIIWPGIICCTPRAFLKKPNTIINLKKDVVIKSNNGAKARMVRMNKTFKELAISFGEPAPKSIFMFGAALAV